MTYCLGMLLEDGLILMTDTRTNAGVDNFSTFRKLHILADGPGLQVYAATAGSLSVSQSVISELREDHLEPGDGAANRSIAEAQTMFQVAQLVGEAVERTRETIGAALAREHIDHRVELLVGGRVGDGPLKLFLIYSIGNFIECTRDVPFMQIGETKYGRPILDRALRHATPLPEAVKIGFLSFDGTMRSNLGVAHAIDVLVLPADPAVPAAARRIHADDAYFCSITDRWADVLYESAIGLPDPDWVPDIRSARLRSASGPAG